MSFFSNACPSTGSEIGPSATSNPAFPHSAFFAAKSPNSGEDRHREAIDPLEHIDEVYEFLANIDPHEGWGQAGRVGNGDEEPQTLASSAYRAGLGLCEPRVAGKRQQRRAGNGDFGSVAVEQDPLPCVGMQIGAFG